MTPSAKRQAVEILAGEHGLSVRRACSAMRLARAAYYRPPEPRVLRDQPVIDALHAVVAESSKWGFWKCFDRLRNLGRLWNHKRVHRVYCALRLNLPRRTRRRVPKRVQYPLAAPPALNHTWALDFMTDTLYDGRRFRTLNVLDEGVREVLDIEVDTSLTGERVIRVVERIAEWRGMPKAIRCDNGPELISQVFVEWCQRHQIELRHIQPGKPNQNPFIERFNRTYRDEVLSAYLFEDLDQVREITQGWIVRYNEKRPHDSLGGLPPAVFRQTKTAEISTLELST